MKRTDKPHDVVGQVKTEAKMTELKPFATFTLFGLCVGGVHIPIVEIPLKQRLLLVGGINAAHKKAVREAVESFASGIIT